MSLETTIKKGKITHTNVMDDLISRKTISIGDRGQMRIPTDQWREMGEPDEAVCDAVTVDGHTEIRLRAAETDE